MKAIYITEPGHVEIREVEKPVRKPGEALLKLLYGGICGSDLGSYRGTFAYFEYPRIPGHGFSAEIVEIDDNEYGLEKGMVVTCNPYFNCGSCYSCQRGLVNACMDNQTMGCQMDGAFCEYITMPLERIYDGKGLDPKLLAAIEPFCISYHGVQRAGIQKGDKVLVVGAGTILNDSPEALEQATADITGQIDIRGNHNPYGFDVCIEAVGLPSTFQNCIDACAFGGKLVLIGVGKQNLDFNFTLIQKKELNVFGSRNALKKNFLELIDLVRSGKVELGKIIIDTYAAEDAVTAFAEFDQHAGEMLKVELDFTNFQEKIENKITLRVHERECLNTFSLC